MPGTGVEDTMMERIRMNKRFWQLVAAGIVAAGVLAPATAAVAVDYPVGGSTVTVSGDPGAKAAVSANSVEVLGKTQTRGQLPFTGGDVAALAAIGGGAVAVGGVLVVQSRRRRSADAV